MTEPAWKQEERQVARALGGERNPLSGESSRHTSGDVIQTPLYVDCKITSSANSTGERYYTLEKDTILETVQAAHEEGLDLPIMTLRWKHCSDRYVMGHCGTLKDWATNWAVEYNWAIERHNHLEAQGQSTYRLYRKWLQDLEEAEDHLISYLTIRFAGNRQAPPDVLAMTWDQFLMMAEGHWDLGGGEE